MCKGVLILLRRFLYFTTANYVARVLKYEKEENKLLNFNYNLYVYLDIF